MEIGLSPLRSGDEQLVQAVIIDISHRKAAERRLREQADQLAVANRYKSEFLANMSHELRTPLNSILILSDQLRQNGAGNLNDKQVRHADIIHRAGHELLQLINDVLDLAKIESGHMQLKLEPLNLRDLLIDLKPALQHGRAEGAEPDDGGRSCGTADTELRSRSPATDPEQPADQCVEVHREGPGRADGQSPARRSGRAADAAAAGPRQRHRDRQAISRSAFSRPSSRSTARSVGITAAPGWGWRSRGNWWKCWAAR